MQQRHLDRKLYFTELVNTSKEFYIDYMRSIKDLTDKTRILEIGCGEGGNLLPFAEIGCQVTGIDIDSIRINNANIFFGEAGLQGTFILSDFMVVPLPKDEDEKYDIVIVHDVIEHIEPPYKAQFMSHMKNFMKTDAIAFFGFPAWQMPFGGHQQMCSGKLSKTPFIHLLPKCLYKAILSWQKEPERTINEMLSIKRSRMPVEKFQRLAKEVGLIVVKKKLWFINPHYKQKFGLRPVPEVIPFSWIPWFRNFYTTSAWFVLRQK